MTPNSPAPERCFLEYLFSGLNESGLTYAVMRNHDPLPYSSGNSDLDLLISPRDGARAKVTVYKAIQQAGGVALGISETTGFFKIYAFGKDPALEGSWWGQRIDVNIGLVFKGQNQLTDNVPWPVTSHHGVIALADGFAGVLGVLKEILNNGTYPKRYAAAARRGCSEDWSDIEILLAPMGKIALEKLREIVYLDIQSETIFVECLKLRKAFLHHARREHPLRYYAARVIHEWSKVRRYFSPSGKVIAFLGADGAGKSTIIDAITPILNSATHNSTVVKHLRPGLMPALSRFKGAGKTITGPVLDPHGPKPSGTIVSIFRLVYLLFDYFMGYWIETRPQIAKHPTVVIFDRYVYDLAIDPKRFRIDLPEGLIFWIVKLVPRPNVIFCLYGKPEVVWRRKQEVSLGELTRQTEVLKAFASREQRAVAVLTDVPLNVARDLVLSEMVKSIIRGMT